MATPVVVQGVFNEEIEEAVFFATAISDAMVVPRHLPGRLPRAQLTLNLIETDSIISFKQPVIHYEKKFHFASLLLFNENCKVFHKQCMYVGSSIRTTYFSYMDEV